MAKFVTQCPSCQSALSATRLSCEACATHLEGKFEVPLLLQLTPEDLRFVTEFLRCSGSLKAMATLLEVSYPTVRNRLDELIQTLNALEQSVQKRRHAILDALENGTISAKAAEQRLRKEGL
jgi:hypothetical protein